MTKTYITRNHEMVMLAILRLGDNAYLVTILDLLNEVTRKEWTIGNLFVALEKLEETGHISAHLGEPRREKGGRAIRYYSVTENGIGALKSVRTAQDRLWQGVLPKIFSS